MIMSVFFPVDLLFMINCDLNIVFLPMGVKSEEQGNSSMPKVVVATMDHPGLSSASTIGVTWLATNAFLLVRDASNAACPAGKVG